MHNFLSPLELIIAFWGGLVFYVSHSFLPRFSRRSVNLLCLEICCRAACCVIFSWSPQPAHSLPQATCSWVCDPAVSMGYAFTSTSLLWSLEPMLSSSFLQCLFEEERPERGCMESHGVVPVCPHYSHICLFVQLGTVLGWWKITSCQDFEGILSFSSSPKNSHAFLSSDPL